MTDISIPNFPVDIFDADGFEWDIQEDGRVSNGTIDAFDGGMDWTGYDPTGSNPVLTNMFEVNLGMTQLTDGDPGLMGSRSIYVSQTLGFARFLDTITNTTGADITYTYTLRTNLGSDGSTTLIADSNGDGVLDTNDTYIITDDSSQVVGDPAVTHFFGDGILAPTSAVLSSDVITITYQITIPAGESVSILTFAFQNTTAAEAIADAESLAENSAALFEGLTPDELGNIINFNAIDAVATPEGDNLVGTTSGETLDGGDGSDYLIGGLGDDVLNGGDGNDVLTGGNGDVQIGDGNDILNGGAGDDVFLFTSSNTNSNHVDANDGGIGNDTFVITEDLGSTRVVDLTAGVFTFGSSNAVRGTLTNIENVTANGDVTIIGDAEDNILIATSATGANTIEGRDGNDTIDGGGGDDTLDGGTGIDTLSYAGTARTDPSSNIGVTVDLSLTTAQNTGLAGTDTVSNFENLIGSDYNDTLSGDENDNVIEGGLGSDTLDGAGGTDTLSYANSTSGVQVNLSLAGSQFTGGAGSDTLSNFENLTGSSYNDTLTGDSNGNFIQGGAGDDTIDGNGGADVIEAGAGDDTVLWSDVAFGNSFDGGDGIDTITTTGINWGSTVDIDLESGLITSGASTITLANFENYDGSANAATSDETARGTSGDNILETGAGNNSLYGRDGNDTLIGGDGNDTLVGGLDNDTLIGGAGNDTLEGGDGIDIADYSGATGAVSVDLSISGGQNTGSAGIDTLSNIETLIGTDLGNSFTGDDGDNVLQGGSGVDTLSGGLGDDVIIGGLGNDSLDGGGGTDLADYSGATSAVTVNLSVTTAQDTLGAGTDTLVNFENLTGSEFDDTLTGDDGDNVIEGGEGADTLDGGDGTDTLSYAGASRGTFLDLATDDALIGPAVTSHGAATGDIFTNFENIIGTNFVDLIVGDNNANILEGGVGNDVLAGRRGGDTLDGGDGVDQANYSLNFSAVSANLSSAMATHSSTVIGTRDAAGSLGLLNDALAGNVYLNVHSSAFPGGEIRGQIGGVESDTTDMAGVRTVVFGTFQVDGMQEVPANSSEAVGLGRLVIVDDGMGNVTYSIDVQIQGLATADITAAHLHGPAPAGVNAGVIVDILSTGSVATETNIDTLVNIENLVGGAFADTLIGDEGENALSGNNGNDTLEGGAGGDSLFGGFGTDTASYAGASEGVFASLFTGTGFTGDAAGDTYDSIEILQGSAFNDILVGRDGESDTLLGGQGSDGLRGNGGDDSLFGEGGNDLFFSGFGADLHNGGSGTDTVLYNQAGAGVIVNLTSGTGALGQAAGDTYVSIENVVGTAFGDLIVGDAGANGLQGRAGNDTLDGRGGADVLNGGNNFDTVTYASSDAGVVASLFTGVGIGGHAQGDSYIDIEALTGSAFNDLLIGRDGAADTLRGGDGSDGLRGNGGDDSLFGEGGNDLLFSGFGADHHDGGAGVDTILYNQAGAGVIVNLASGTGAIGQAAGDTYVSIENVVGTAFGDLIVGSAGANNLQGRAGNDVLDGRAGADVLIGGNNADRFVFDAGYGTDRIEDFTSVDGDIIDVRGFGFTSFAQVQALMFSSGGDTVINFGGGDALRLVGVDINSLSASDFLLSGSPNTKSAEESATFDEEVFVAEDPLAVFLSQDAIYDGFVQRNEAGLLEIAMDEDYDWDGLFA